MLPPLERRTIAIVQTPASPAVRKLRLQLAGPHRPIPGAAEYPPVLPRNGDGQWAMQRLSLAGALKSMACGGSGEERNKWQPPADRRG